jgi:hypothetical protein
MSNQDRSNTIKFNSGNLLATSLVLEQISLEEIHEALNRHRCCDWGDVSESDRETNDRAFQEGYLLMSVYHDKNGIKFYIITTSDRSTTRVMLPDEYD